MTKRMQMKQDLKDLAVKIRNGKSGRKPKNLNKSNEKDYNKLVWNRTKFRYIHIAYCLMRGRTMEQIERPREDNIPREDQIKKYIELYSPEEMQEAA
jgi:hypothetical protein